MLKYLVLFILFPFVVKAQGLNEERFNHVLERLETVYAPIVQNLGATLDIEASWRNGTQNAFARRYDSDGLWSIVIYGGLARMPGVTEDALTLVLCHELGHHLAGAPYKAKDEIVSWASAEGAADLYATAVCFKKMFAEDDNEAFIKDMNVPSFIVQNCQENALCVRSIMASKSMMELVGYKGLSLEKRDESVVMETNLNYPGGQCRLDTLVAGALCAEDHDCPKPVCWYSASRL